MGSDSRNLATRSNATIPQARENRVTIRPSFLRSGSRAMTKPRMSPEKIGFKMAMTTAQKKNRFLRMLAFSINVMLICESYANLQTCEFAYSQHSHRARLRLDGLPAGVPLKIVSHTHQGNVNDERQSQGGRVKFAYWHHITRSALRPRSSQWP